MANTELYLTGARLLANALSLPKQMQAANQEQAMQQALLQLAQGQEVSPETMQAFQPPQGTAGKIMSGVGDVGAVLSGVLGSPVRAPRMDTNALATITQQGQKQKANAEIAGQYKHPRAQALARLGRFSEAESVERGGTGGKGTSELAVLIQSGLDQGMDEPAARRWALEQLQTRFKERGAFTGGISRGNTMASQGNAAGIADTDRAEKRERGRQFLRGQDITPDQGGAVIPQSAPADPRNGGFTLISDTSLAADAGVPSQPALQRRRATVSSEGEASVTYGPDPASDTTATGRARVLSVEEAQKLGVPLGTTVAEANALREGQPPPPGETPTSGRLKNIRIARAGVRKLVDATQALTQSPALAATRVQQLGLAWDQWRGDPRAAAIGAASLLAPSIRKAMGDTGNMAQQEQQIVVDAVLPGGRDTEQGALQKLLFIDELLGSMEAAETGQMPAPGVREMIVQQLDRFAPETAALLRQGVQGGATPGASFDDLLKQYGY